LRDWFAAERTPDILYRFRSTDALLGERKELERREIYLARPQELNDPMEGYKDVFWRGDAVLWENLVSHYVLALLWCAMGFLLAPDDSFEEPNIPATLTADDLPTDAFRKLYAEARDDFLARRSATSACSLLTKIERPLRREGLRLVLSLVHSDAFAAVISTMRKGGFIRGDLPLNDDARGDVLGRFEEAVPQVGEAEFEKIAFAANIVRQQQSLRALLALDGEATKLGARKTHYLVFTFTDRYVEGVVEELVHFGWRAACFSSTCTNASNWAAYGDQHRGAALVFRPRLEGDSYFLPLQGIIGSSAGLGIAPSPIRGAINGEISRVEYSNRPQEIDFFRSLGTIPMKKLERTWRTNRVGDRSGVISEIMASDAAWRAAYWRSFYRVATTKLEDWKHEAEFRIVMSDMLGLRQDKASAKVTYDFASLVGIVFGMRTPDNDKVAIIKQVRSMCERAKRTDFAFHQMKYDGANGCLTRI
jgi:hypothetical protein